MRVVIVPSWYFPFGYDGISGRMFHHLAKALIAEGIEAEIFYPDLSRKGPLLRKTQLETEDGVPTYRVQQWFPPKGNAFLFNRWISRGARELMKYIDKRGAPDLLHAQSYHAAAICAAVNEKTNIPFIYTERLSSFITKQIPPFHLEFFREIFTRASLITCVSPGLMDRLLAHAHIPIKVVPNFFDENIFFPDPSIQKYEAFTYVSVGEPARTKGLDILIEAYGVLKQKLPDVAMQLILVDKIPEKEELMTLATRWKIENQIIWKELISQEELAEICNRSHVFVSASRVETFGKAILEAQACGLPVIATKTDGATFIMGSFRQGILTETNDPEALMKAMGKLYAGYAQFRSSTLR